MKGLENQAYLVAYIISNAIALFLLFASGKWPRLARTLFILLFGWASYANWTMALNSPDEYLGYAQLSFLSVYREFIQGWFSTHILLAVGFIATAQAGIAIGLTLRGKFFRLACWGAIVFLLAIIPLGVGSAFPCTLILALGVYILLRNQHAYLWQAEEMLHPE